MKTFKIAVLITAAMICLGACGNVGAQNKKHNTTGTPYAVVELTAEEFNAKVYDTSLENAEFLGKRPAIVDFSATWCGPCKRLSPILEELAMEYKGKVDIYKVDVDKCRKLAETFNISSIPAILYIPLKGESVMTVGSRGKSQFIQEINTYLLNNAE
jgi:thioredoxin